MNDIEKQIKRFRRHKGMARKFQALGKAFLAQGRKAEARDAARKMLAEKHLADMIEEELGETISE